MTNSNIYLYGTGSIGDGMKISITGVSITAVTNPMQAACVQLVKQIIYNHWYNYTCITTVNNCIHISFSQQYICLIYLGLFIYYKKLQITMYSR